jgi:hypothetical protein
MKIRYHFATLLLIITSICMADASEKVYTLRHLPEKITVDGIIDPMWNTLDSISDFVQQAPYHHKSPSMRTVAKVFTTDDAMYCLMINYDDPEHIEKNTGKLDDGSGDVVSIMFDTFGDKHSAYKCAVTSGGVRADCRLLDDARNRDYNWDGIWFADSKVYDWGFVVEMEIPYKSLQYGQGLTEWGLDFDRWNPSRSEDLYWCSYEENEGQRISKFGKLLFKDFYPSVTGLNLEIYPVGITKVNYIREGKYKGDPNLGLDIFYNPSEQLTFQLTANPDFAQIEADPYDFNISRYESYFSERRPFFTEGNEIFMPSGKERNSGFYEPLQLFYSRRIGKKLPDGTEVPLTVGTRAFGRLNDWEYGGFVALTDETPYDFAGTRLIEPRAQFASVRLKRQILGNSSIGLLFVGKHSDKADNGVLDIDGAFRGSNWQLAYQVAGSYDNSVTDFASSFGYRMVDETYAVLLKGRFVNSDFNVDQVGYVPWKGTGNFVGLVGPRWYFKEGYISELSIYAGPIFGYKKFENYTDHGGLLGFNMALRDNWGWEIDLNYYKEKDRDTDASVIFNCFEIDYSAWFNISPKWNANIYGGYAKTYNFTRHFLSFYNWNGLSFDWRAAATVSLGTSLNMYVEGDPRFKVQDITYNARPYISFTPVNDMNIRVYVDNVFVRSTDRMEQIIGGFLFSYNFLPKSWIYLALNEFRNRSDEFDGMGNTLPNRMHVAERAGVIKLKYLYYL